MSPKEVRLGRREVPDMDNNNRSRCYREALSSLESSESSTVNRSMSPKDMNKPCNYSSSWKSERTPPVFTLNSCCCGVESKSGEISSAARRCYAVDAAKSRTTTLYDKLCQDTRIPSNGESKVSRCNCCRNVEDCNRDLSTRHRAASSERFTSANDSLNDECKSDDVNVRRRSWTRNSSLLGNRTWQIVSFIILSFVCVCSGDSNQCAVGLKTPGRTWPQGDIVLEYGQSLRILCMLNKTFIDVAFPGKNSSDLVFFRNKKEIEPEFISVVNDTTIAMYVEKPPPAEDMYYCKLRLNDEYSKQHEAVCLNKVVIGFKPQEPQNFSCVSHNWENMICSWDPVQNFVTTRFTLVFKLPGRAGGRKLYPCPKDNQKPLPPNTCLWDTTTNPIYRQPYEYYTFIMNVTNVLGYISVPYKFHHFAHVIPAKPANLSVVNKTSDSALLHWSVPFPMQNFPPGLHHRVAYQHQWDHRKTWQVINITSDIHTHKRHYNLSGLEFANTKYDVRIFMKSALAIGEDKWSQFSGLTFRTSPRLPGQPPRTDIGSFEIAENNANRDVYLYWQAIPPYLENGDNFKYQIAHVEENGRKLYVLPNETTRTYAKFKGISFNSFRFEVVTTNVVGSNEERARIFVPSRLEMPHEPLAFTKIAFDGGLYELSWKPPINNAEITNYTIFWCDNDRDRPYQCTGYLDWVHVSANTTIYNMTVPDPRKVYQFAISANTPRASSGMVWASCTVIHNKVVGKMKSVWINRIGSVYIEVGWKLDCSDRVGIVEGFDIYYCPIVSPFNINCKGPKLNKTIPADPHTIHGCIEGLKPYTTYMIAVAVLTKNGEGLHSEPLYNTTLEAAPSTPPQDVKVTNITNSTMFVSWVPPTAMNGVLRYYEVHYNTHSQKVEEVDHVVLKDLVAHRNYSISVVACTVSCSARSPAVFRTTDIGVPGKIVKTPQVRFMNSSQVLVKWTPPYSVGGLLDYYQIMSADGEIRNSTKYEERLPIADCKTARSEQMYQFRVRAVNIAPDGTHLEGPWSEAGEGNCYSGGPSFKVWIIIWVISSVSGLAFLFCLAYSFKRMWLKCKAMQDVEVKLPPGLAPNMKLLQKVGEQHMRQSSADSSGCSSGQESVTSSLTSDSHVSSDSGADVDPVHPPANNKLLETPPTWEASRLRQRNVGTTRPGGTNDSPRWDSYVKVAKTGEPILDDSLSLARSTPNLTDSTGYTASPQAWSSTGYISMPSSEELSSNPSPVPKESSNQGGGYSVVGVAPKPLRLKSDEPPSDIATQLKPTAVPYVTLASLEQKSKDKKSTVGCLRDLEAFIEPNVDTLKPMSLLEKTSKPYVQTGFMDSMKKQQTFAPIPSLDAKVDMTKTSSFAPTLTDPRKPFASTFTSPRTFKQALNAESSSVSKPYVAVGSIAEVTTKPSSAAAAASHISLDAAKQKPLLVPAKTGSEATSKPYVTAASAFQMLQQQRDKHEVASTLDDEEIEKNLSSPYSLCWQTDAAAEASAANEKTSNVEKSVAAAKRSPSYVAVGENPRLEQQQQSSSVTNSPYVQHQRFEKQLPTQPSVATTATDEQYSKVSVAPNTMQ